MSGSPSERGKKTTAPPYPATEEYVLVNGNPVRAREATVSIFDRGFWYGDGLFETLRTYRGSLLALDAHLDRLAASASALDIPLPARDWAREIAQLLRRNSLGESDAAVRIIVTRGPAPPGLAPPRQPLPTTVVVTTPIAPEIAMKQRRGVAVTLLDFRRNPRLARYKLLDYVPAIIGRIVATRSGCDDGLYTKPGGGILEGTTGSFFLVRAGGLYTPPARGILPGITRAVILHAARVARIPVHIKELTKRQAFNAEEAFLASSVSEIVPILRVGDRPIGSGRPGALTRLLQHDYRTVLEHWCESRRRRQRRRPDEKDNP